MDETQTTHEAQIFPNTFPVVDHQEWGDLMAPYPTMSSTMRDMHHAKNVHITNPLR